MVSIGRCNILYLFDRYENSAYIIEHYYDIGIIGRTCFLAFFPAEKTFQNSAQGSLLRIHTYRIHFVVSNNKHGYFFGL